MTFAEFINLLEARGHKPRQGGDQWTARCPGHEDQNPSLGIKEGLNGRVLVHCFAGCTPEHICESLGLKLSDLMPPKPNHRSDKLGQVVARYDYVDEQGQALFQVVRFEPKSFRQRHRNPDGSGGWIWDVKGIRAVPYRLPEVLQAVAAGQTVHIVEGEKDADAMSGLGLVATCNAGGAGKWREEFSQFLQGADVAIIADKDKAGRKHARQVSRSLADKAKSVRTLELPDRDGRKIKDASDWFAAGGTVEELARLVQAAPLAKLEPEVTADEEDHLAAEVRGRIIKILSQEDASITDQRTEIGQAVVDVLTQAGQFYYRAERRDFATAMFFDARRKVLLGIQSDPFQAWLSSWLCLNRANQSFNYVMRAVENAALCGKQTQGIWPEAYWAARPGALYLSNGDGAIVKITPNNLSQVDNGTDGVLFAAGRCLPPWQLITPKDPFDSCAAFRDVNCTAPHGKDLLRAWLLSVPANPRCKPPLALIGTVGSGKTRLGRAMSELFGIPYLEVKADESKEGDFWPCMEQGGLVTLDNADTRIRWLPDTLAAAATDGCSVRRRLYTDTDTVVLRARAWIIVTSANPTFASDPGLADRLLVVRMGRRTGATSDAALSDEIAAHRDASLSFIAHALARALADTAPTPAGLNSRHPDFAAFAVRIGRALGCEPSILAALRNAESDKARFCLENDPLGAALLALPADGLQGTASELVSALRQADPELEWLTPKKLGRRLNALWPHVQSMMKARKWQDGSGTRYAFELLTVASVTSEEPVSGHLAPANDEIPSSLATLAMEPMSGPASEPSFSLTI